MVAIFPENRLAARALELEKREAEMRRDNGLLFYRPHAKQELFHTNAHFRYRYARTGNRFGKSEMGAAEDVSFALGYRPWLPVGDQYRTSGIPQHPTKGLIVTTDWGKSREIFTDHEDDSDGARGIAKGKIYRYIPHDCLGHVTKNHGGYIEHIQVRHVSGGWSTIRFETVQSYKQDPLGLESSDYDWVHIDEPIPEKMFGAINRGLVDRAGKVWFTCTPLSEPWIDQAFTPDTEAQLTNDISRSSSSTRWMMTGTMDDNPYNTKQSIEETLSWYTEDERECRRKGIPTAYSGLVYREFDYNIHVRKDLALPNGDRVPNPPPGWKDWETPPADHTIRFAIDYHFRKNDAVLFIATSPTEHCYIFAELWRQMLVEEEVKEIKRIHGACERRPGLIDPLASTPNKVNERTALDEYLSSGLGVIPATKDPVNGIRAVKAFLKQRDKQGNAMLQINPACTRTIFEIARGFIWDGDANKPIKKFDDMMENLYRLVMQGLSYVAPADLSDWRPRESNGSGLFDNIVDASDFLRGDKPEPRVDRSQRYRA